MIRTRPTDARTATQERYTSYHLTTDPAFNEAFAFLDTVSADLGDIPPDRAVQYLRTELGITDTAKADAIYEAWIEYLKYLFI